MIPSRTIYLKRGCAVLKKSIAPILKEIDSLFGGKDEGAMTWEHRFRFPGRIYMFHDGAGYTNFYSYRTKENYKPRHRLEHSGGTILQVLGVIR